MAYESIIRTGDPAIDTGNMAVRGGAVLLFLAVRVDRYAAWNPGSGVPDSVISKVWGDPSGAGVSGRAAWNSDGSCMVGWKNPGPAVRDPGPGIWLRGLIFKKETGC